MNTIRIGFTGTRKGMTKAQMLAIYGYLSHVMTVHDTAGPATVEVHHGDCVGADAQFHVIATVLGCRTVAHPPSNPALRAWCPADEIREPADYIARDWAIARETGELLATPADPVAVPHSGTWATIAIAVSLHRPVKIFAADGRTGNGREILDLAGI